MEIKAFSKISQIRSRTTSRGIPEFSKTFSPMFSLHSTLLQEYLELSVEWFTFRNLNSFRILWKLFREISVSFAAVS